MLSEVKVYVGKQSKEIQEKAFRLGWFWCSTENYVSNLDSPFLFFSEDKSITMSNDVIEFNDDDYKEVTPEWILSLPEPAKKIEKEKGVRGFYVDNQGKVSKKNYLYNPEEMKHFRFFSTEEKAQAWAKLPELSYWVDKYNQGWKPNFNDTELKHTIKVYRGEICAEDGRCYNEILVFKSREIRDNFLEDFKDLIETCKIFI